MGVGGRELHTDSLAATTTDRQRGQVTYSLYACDAGPHYNLTVTGTEGGGRDGPPLKCWLAGPGTPCLTWGGCFIGPHLQIISFQISKIPIEALRIDLKLNNAERSSAYETTHGWTDDF